MRLLLIRHGADAPGYRGGWSGRGLSACGLAESVALGRFLHDEWRPIDLLLSSDLPRAAETAEAIARALSLPVQTAPEWRETNNGDLAGMPNAEAETHYPGLYFASLDMDEPYPNGESPRQFQTRIARTFAATSDAIVVGRLPANVAVVAHGGVINVVYYLLKGRAWSNREPGFPIAHVSIHEIGYRDGTWLLMQENVIAPDGGRLSLPSSR